MSTAGLAGRGRGRPDGPGGTGGGHPEAPVRASGGRFLCDVNGETALPALRGDSSKRKNERRQLGFCTLRRSEVPVMAERGSARRPRRKAGRKCLKHVLRSLEEAFGGLRGMGFPEGETAWVLEPRRLFLGGINEDLSLRASWRLGRGWLHRNCRQLQGNRPFCVLPRPPQKPGRSSSGKPAEAGGAG